MSTGLHILAVGARTPLGAEAASTAAAVRAGLTALEQHPFMVDQVGDLMPAAMDALLDPRLKGVERLAALAASAAAEACAALKTTLPKLPVFLGLPEVRPGFGEGDAAAVGAALARAEPLAARRAEVRVFPAGHAAGITALAAAAGAICSGAAEACLVGGVDSYFHPDTMEWLDANRQLAGAVSRSGFVPGEGAAFALLGTESAAARLDLAPLAAVRSVATGRETKLIKTKEMCLGEGLTAAVRDAVGVLHPPDERVNAVVCDVNGERYRSEEWGFVCLRASRYFDDPTAYDSPADFWGDVGAASAPLFAALVCQAHARGYARGPRTLLWCSSERGERGAVLLETAGAANGSGPN